MVSTEEYRDSKEPLRQKQLKRDDIHKTGVTRFIVAALLSISLLLTCEIWISFAAVTSSTMLFFSIKNASTCDWFSVVFFVTFAIQAIPSLFLPQLIGIKRCIITGTTLIFIGCVMRTASFLLGYPDGTPTKYTDTSFWMAMIGNVIVSFSQCLLSNIPSLVSSVYFEQHQQLSSTTWIMNGCILGTAVGFIFPPLIMGETTDILQIQRRFIIITLTESVICGIVIIASIIVIPSTPPPSSSSLSSSSSPTVLLESTSNENVIKQKCNYLLNSIKESFKGMWQLLKSPVFIWLFLIYGLYYALSSMFYITLSDIITQNLGSNKTTLITYSGSLAVIAGAIFSVILSALIEKFGSFRLSIIAASLLMFMNAAPLFIMCMLSHYKKHTTATICTLTILYGMAAAPYLSLGYDILSKAAAPMSANIPVTIALVFSNVLSVILTYGGNYIPNDNRNQIFLVLFTCLYVVMGIIHIFIRVKPSTSTTM